MILCTWNPKLYLYTGEIPWPGGKINMRCLCRNGLTLFIKKWPIDSLRDTEEEERLQLQAFNSFTARYGHFLQNKTPTLLLPWVGQSWWICALSRDLYGLDAISSRKLREPNLSNEIHPIFRAERWELDFEKLHAQTGYYRREYPNQPSLFGEVQVGPFLFLFPAMLTRRFCSGRWVPSHGRIQHEGPFC